MPRPRIKTIDLKEVKPLRERWLVEPGLMPEVDLPLDKARSTRHFGAIVQGKIFGVVTIQNEPRPALVEPKAWRLCGLGVAPGLREEGLGRLLVQAVSRDAARRQGSQLWANVPVDVVDFFSKTGFEIAGDVFESADLGPHHRVLMKPKAR